MLESLNYGEIMPFRNYIIMWAIVRRHHTMFFVRPSKSYIKTDGGHTKESGVGSNLFEGADVCSAPIIQQVNPLKLL